MLDIFFENIFKLLFFCIFFMGVNKISFKDKLFRLASKKKYIVAFPEFEDSRIVEAYKEIEKEGFAIPVIVGNGKVFFKKHNFKDNFRFVDLSFEDSKNSLLDYYVSLRKKKGKKVSSKELSSLKKDYVGLSMLLLHSGLFDVVISGASHSTSNTLKWAFKIIGTRKGVRKASSFFIMDKESKGNVKEDVLFFSDCAVQINPDSKDLSEIGFLTAFNAKKLGLKPKVAFLSFSTKGSAVSSETLKVKNAVSILKRKCALLNKKNSMVKINEDFDCKSFLFDGELQFDAAVDPVTAKRKGAFDVLKGNSNVFVFPDLNSGNIGYKIMRIYGKYKAYGPILQGLNKPVVDLSRSVSVDEIVDIVALVCALK